MSTRILKAVEHFFDSYGDSGLVIYTIRSKQHPTPHDLQQLGLVGHHCGHSHDCCGCMQWSGAYDVHHNKRNEYRATVHFYRNV